MSLIDCPECGKEISDKVKRCPNCGYRLKSKKNNCVKIGAILNIIGVLGFWIMMATIMLLPSSQQEQSDTSGDITISIEPDYQNIHAELGIIVLVTYSLLMLVLSICILRITKKTVKIILAIIMIIVTIICGVAIVYCYDWALMCCFIWFIFFMPITNFIGSILCLIGSLIGE